MRAGVALITPDNLSIVEEVARRRPRIGPFGGLGAFCCLVVVLIIVLAVVLITRNRRRP